MRRLSSGRLRRRPGAAEKRRRARLIWSAAAMLLVLVGGCLVYYLVNPAAELLSSPAGGAEIPAYAGSDVIELGGGLPSFTAEDVASGCFVEFSPLDSLGRTGAGTACLGPETLPTQPRERIDPDIRPSGWHSVRYDDLIEDGYLYNRCHVVGYLLCGDNDTPENLFTGTRHLNTVLMLPYEKSIAECIEQSGMHVLYRCTPRYRGGDALAFGVELEAYSVEDSGREICIHVFIYNVQPGVEIDYRTGQSRRAA